MMASNGFSGGYERTSRSISAVAITGEGLGMERDWAAESRAFQADLPAPEDVGRLAGQRTVERAGAQKPVTGGYPVLFDERIAGSLIGHILSAANGSSVVRGASWLRDALGAQILPKLACQSPKTRTGRVCPVRAPSMPKVCRQ
jgi:PmbA protein